MKLTLMTWNVENLFRQPDDPAAYEAKLTGLAAIINQQKPQVLALQEIGSPEALDDLKARLEGDWHSQLSAFPDSRGIRVGFLALHALTDSEDIVALPDELTPLQINDERTKITRSGRGALAVSVQLGSTTLRLVNAHLKSKLITYPGGRFSPRDEDERARYAAYALYRRTAEAAMVRTYCNRYLTEQGKARPLVLMGDMNDEPGAATTQMLLGPGGSELGSRAAMTPDAGDGSRLFNLTAWLPPEQQQTRVYRGRGEIIDHIMVSRALLEHAAADGIRTVTAKLPSVSDNPNERSPSEPSDHAAVLATLQV